MTFKNSKNKNRIKLILLIKLRNEFSDGHPSTEALQGARPALCRRQLERLQADNAAADRRSRRRTERTEWKEAFHQRSLKGTQGQYQSTAYYVTLVRAVILTNG